MDAVEVEKYQGGVEAAVSIWFNGMNRVGPVNLNFEHKRSHDKDIGYLTAEMGTLMRYLEDPETPFYQQTLARIIPTLRAANYRGQIDLGFKVTPEGYFPTEFTPRIGKPSWALEDELHITPWADLAMACASGQNIDLQVRYDWAVGVVLAAFGFPHEDKIEKISKGRTIDGLNEHTLDHLHPWNVELNKKGQFVVSSGQGYVLVATGRGSEIDAAKRRAYDAIASLKLRDSYKRFDISDKLSAYQLDDLGILPLEEAVVSPP
jgi:phosphoribosylamine--glycine ligase